MLNIYVGAICHCFSFENVSQCFFPLSVLFLLLLWFFYLQITQWQIGYMPAPQGRSDALTQSTRLSNWKRSFCSICTLLETADSRSLGSWIWPRGRSKSGFRTGEWRWRKWTKKRATAKNNNMDCSQKTTIITTSHMDSTDVPKLTINPLSSSSYLSLCWILY